VSENKRFIHAIIGSAREAVCGYQFGESKPQIDGCPICPECATIMMLDYGQELGPI